MAKVGYRRPQSRQATRGAVLHIVVPLVGVAVIAIIGSAFVPAPSSSTPQSQWAADMQRRHLIARDGCRAAQAVGLAPAYAGEPGYWEEWDGDGDGISCERW